jgi:ribosomal protein L19E
LSETDIEEVRKLREVASTLRDQDAVNKVIWKVYYEKPCSDLVGRVEVERLKPVYIKLPTFKIK